MNRISILHEIIENIEKVIVDKREVIELVLITYMCKGHILIEDIPGVGKTSLASALAKSINCSFKRIQFTPDIMPSDITGFSMYSPKTGEFEFRPGAILSKVVLADEINRTSPKTQASLLEAMEEKQVTVDGSTYKIKEPFIVLATQNPIDFLGTYPLPEAQMDRFFMRISVGYPSKESEEKMMEMFGQESPLKALQAVASEEDILRVQALAELVYVDKHISDYIVSLVRSTRENPYVSLGASPRASIALYKAAKAWALYNARDYVLPDDVIYMSHHVLSHRIVLNQEAKIKKIQQKEIVDMTLKNVRVPVVQK